MQDFSFLLGNDFKLPQIDVYGPYKQALTLRQLTDEREYRKMQMRALDLKAQQEAREEREREAFKVAVARGEDPEKLLSVHPELASKLIQNVSAARTQQRLEKTADEELRAKKTEQQRKINEAMANIGMQAAQIQDPAEREQYFQQGMAGALIDAGVTPAEQFGAFPVPRDQRAAEMYFASVNGPDELRKYKAALEKDAQEAALFPYKTREQIARTATAEGEATGTQPVSPYQQAQLAQNRWGSPEGLIAVLNDPRASEADKERALAGLNRHQELRKAGAASTVISPNQTIANEAKLRDDYIRDTKNYPVIRDAFSKISRASESHTGPGDISLIYGYMRMLDPGSTVREGEFATAQNAGSIPQQVWAMYNKAVRGERLDPAVRAQFVAEAQNIYEQSTADYLKTRDLYSGVATRGNMDPRNVVIDLTPASPPKKSGGAGASPAGVPKVGDTFQGSRVKSVTKVK